jgi:hypothetical protein
MDQAAMLRDRLQNVLLDWWRGSNPLTPTMKSASQCKYLAGFFLPDEPEKVPHRYQLCTEAPVMRPPQTPAKRVLAVPCPLTAPVPAPRVSAAERGRVTSR